jgi:hypothetical protein
MTMINNFDLCADSQMFYSSDMATATPSEPLTSQVTLLHRISNIVSSELSLDEMLILSAKSGSGSESGKPRTACFLLGNTL